MFRCISVSLSLSLWTNVRPHVHTFPRRPPQTHRQLSRLSDVSAEMWLMQTEGTLIRFRRIPRKREGKDRWGRTAALFKMARCVRRWRTLEGVLGRGADKIRRISGNPVILLRSSQADLIIPDWKRINIILTFLIPCVCVCVWGVADGLLGEYFLSFILTSVSVSFSLSSISGQTPKHAGCTFNRVYSSRVCERETKKRP